MPPLRGRDEAVDAASQAVLAAADGFGRTVCFEGPAGSGRSALVRVAAALAADRGVTVIGAAGRPGEADLPLGLAARILEPILARSADHRDRLRRVAPALHLPPFFDGPAPLARDQPEPVDGPAPLARDQPERDGGHSRSTEISTLHDALALLAVEGPLLVTIDDVEWADAASLRCLTYLGHRVDRLPISLLILGNPGPCDRTLAELLDTSSLPPIVLDPLDDDSAEALIRDRAGPGCPNAVVDRCVAAADGNPSLLAALADAAGDRSGDAAGGHEDDAARGRSDDAAGDRSGDPPRGEDDPAIPPTVMRFAERRLRPLDDPARRLAEAVAIVDGSGGPAVATEVAGVDDDAAVGGWRQLHDRGLLRDDERPRLAQPILRDAVVHALAPSERERLHRATADALTARAAPAPLIAPHLAASRHRLDAEGIATLRSAAAVAGAAGHPADAVRYLERVDAEPLDPETRLAVRRALAIAAVEDQGEAGLGRFGASAAVATTADERLSVALDHAAALESLGRPDGAACVLADAEATLEPDVDVLADAKATFEPDVDILADAAAAPDGAACMPAEADAKPTPEGDADPEDVAARRRRIELRLAALVAEPTLRAAVLPRLLAATNGLAPTGTHALELLSARAFADLGVGSGGAAARTARDVLNALVDSDPAACDPEIRSFELCVVTAMLTGQLDLASTAADREIARSQSRDDGVRLARGLILRARIRYLQGRLVEAEADARGALERLAGRADRIPVDGPATLIAVLVERGLLDDAEEIVARYAEPPGPRPGTARDERSAATAVLRIAQGRPDDAVTALDALLPRSSSAALTRVGPYLAHALLAGGDRAAAADQARACLRRARADDAGPIALGVALGAVGSCESGAPGLHALEDAVIALRPTGCRLDLAHALIRLGTALRQRRRRADARPALREGLDLAIRCGATPLAQRAQEELAATGRRVRRGDAQERDGLTPSEQRIALLAVEGRTNRQIAQELFVTAKTIEMHLSSVYRKLGIRSRGQLTTVQIEAAAVGDPEVDADDGAEAAGVEDAAPGSGVR